jgi:membrane-bound lytic murein transglycosylase MltF
VAGLAAVVALFLVGGAASGQNDRFGDSSTGDGNPDPASLGGALYGVYTDDLPKLRERGVIRVLTTYSRTNFYLERGEIDGFEYRLLTRFERWLNKNRPKGTPPIKLVYIPMPFEDVLPALDRGDGDLAAAFLTVTPARSARVAFSRPYLTGLREVVVTRSGVLHGSGIEALSGLTITLVSGTSFEDTVERVNRSLLGRGLDPAIVRTVGQGVDQEDLLTLVGDGSVEATVSDLPIAKLWQKIVPGLDVHEGWALSEGNEISFAARPDNPELLGAVDAFLGTVPLKEIATVGRVYAEKVHKAETERRTNAKQFEHLLDIVKKESAAAGMDWRLVAAQVQKESGFNPRAQSQAGAQGLMQLMPATAREVGVTDPFDPTQNVRGGIKYMLQMRDTHFREGGVTEMERWRFLFAGYNGGPTRINRLREKASASGLDPDIYFNHVERLVIKQRLAETYFYVRQIEAFYLAYSLAEERPAAELLGIVGPAGR